MKKRITLLLALVLAISCAFGMIGCGHTHTFSSDWTSDAENHWHVATCEHTEEISDKAAHSFVKDSVKKVPTEEEDGILTMKCSVCGYKKDVTVTVADLTGIERDEYDGADTLVLGYANFSEKFSPFFADSAYDMDVQAMTQVSLLASTRGGAIVYDGITGEKETLSDGSEYTYYGLGKVVVTTNADNTVDYDITIRSGDNAVYFSDGKEVTIDDVIFTMYVYSDPAYSGSTTFFSLPIEGMEEYRAGMDLKWKVIYSDILADKTDYLGTIYTQEEMDTFKALFNKNGLAFAQDIVDFCLENYAAYGAVDFASSAALWGFGGVKNAQEFWDAIVEAYEGDISGIDKEAANFKFSEKLVSDPDFPEEFGKTVKTGESAATITGIVKTGDASLRLHMSEFSATTIYQLSMPVAPMHYYGDAEKYDYANAKFGFDKGDLSGVEAKTTTPMGAGPYKFVSYKDGIVSFEKNDLYFLGAPYIKYLKFKEYNQDSAKTPAVVNGEIDVATPSINDTVLNAIKKANSNGELIGNVVYTDLVDYNGYGYLGISANRIKVGDDKSSDASKNLRKAFATLAAAYREYTVNGYYGDRASVINYPISNCSWAAPQPIDDGYEVAYSKDVDGNPIYTADMSDEVKAEKALEAAVGFLKAAGYTYDEATGKFTAAPEGASMTYTAWIPGDGEGDHPSFAMLTKTRDALATVGITLEIRDLTNSSELWDGLDADTVDMWVAAWGGSSDPDMYQIYHSSDTTGSNHYHIADTDLDELIIEARKSPDNSYRKQLYKQALDLVLDWAVEIPVYQRKDCSIYSAERVNLSTVTKDTTPYWTILSEIENLKMNPKSIAD